MKKALLLHKILIASLSIVLSVMFSGCFKDNISRTYMVMHPVYATKAEVLADINTQAPVKLSAPGKIFIFGRYLFVNEVDRGVHIFDNSNPRTPKAVSFLRIPGNLDIAVKNNTLYADMYSDLLVIDITDPFNSKVEMTVPNVFPERNYGNTGFRSDSTLMIVDWIKKDTTVNVDEGTNRTWLCTGCFVADVSTAAFAGSKSGTTVPGIAGSMSRFSLVNDYLYTVNTSSLEVFDIHNPEDPHSKGVFNVGQSIETIYPFEGKLFIGSAGGMFIFNIDRPEAPQAQGAFTHARACDPVVADGDYAFVTLRSGSRCTGFSNQLDVVDVRDVYSPHLLKTYLMTNPHGLAKDGDLLFICDGADGMKVYDADDVRDLKMIKHIKGINAYDAIAWNERLLVVGSDGLYQFNYGDRSNIKLLSKVSTSSK